MLITKLQYICFCYLIISFSRYLEISQNDRIFIFLWNFASLVYSLNISKVNLLKNLFWRACQKELFSFSNHCSFSLEDYLTENWERIWSRKSLKNTEPHNKSVFFSFLLSDINIKILIYWWSLKNNILKMLVEIIFWVRRFV
jgi:hypothetical protein